MRRQRQPTKQLITVQGVVRLLSHTASVATVIAKASIAYASSSTTFIPIEGKVAKWSFIEKKEGSRHPVQPGKSLIPQLPSPDHCCTGTYRTTLNLRGLGLATAHGQAAPSYSILIPITGGLRRASLDEFEAQFPNRDYSSIETLLPVSPELLERDHVTFSIEIESPPSFYAGMWNNSPLLGETEKVLEKRDKNFAFQVLVPDFLAIFLLVFAAIFAWCWRRIQSPDPLYGEFATALACWGIYYLFLSGEVRSWLPFFGGMFHMPMRLVALTTLTRVIAIFAGIPRSQLRKATYVGIALGALQIATNLAYLEDLQPFIFIPFALFIGYANIRMARSIKSKLDLLFFSASAVASFGFISDTIRIASTFFDFSYPIFYLNRYTTPPLLFTSVVYLAYKLSREAEVSVKQRAYEHVSSQVAHDIKSPLAALAVAERNLNVLPEDIRILIRSAVGRIQDIANQLLERKSPFPITQFEQAASTELTPESTSPHLLPSIVGSIVSEKRLQFRKEIEVDIDAILGEESYGLFARIQPTEFKRVLSNLINNAVESLPNERGHVSIRIATVDPYIEIRVQDNGRGIPPDILTRLLRHETLSFEKMGGYGLGLSHARTFTTSWGGSLQIQSQIGIGTTVIVRLPKAPSPDWFVKKIEVDSGTNVVILDDDESIHQIWKRRFDLHQARMHNVHLSHFSTPEAIYEWSKANRDAGKKALYLIDYELLGHSRSGLDVAEKLGVATQSILVTSRFEEPVLLRRCTKLGTRLIPKAMAGFVPISIESYNTSIRRLTLLDAVLIDDDPIVRLTWEQAARTDTKNIATFSDTESFLKVAPSLDRATPIFIDSHLDDDALSGEDAAKDIVSVGFKTVHLSTGFPASSFDPKKFPWISGITGKEVPWTTT